MITNHVRKSIDNSVTGNVSERRLSWNSQNRLRGLSDNDYLKRIPK